MEEKVILFSWPKLCKSETRLCEIAFPQIVQTIVVSIKLQELRKIGESLGNYKTHSGRLIVQVHFRAARKSIVAYIENRVVHLRRESRDEILE